MLIIGNLKKFNTQVFNNQEGTQEQPMLQPASQPMVEAPHIHRLAEEVRVATQEWVEAEQQQAIPQQHQAAAEATLQASTSSKHPVRPMVRRRKQGGVKLRARAILDWQGI